MDPIRPHDPSTTNPAALYAVCIHQDDQARLGYAREALASVREHLPQGAQILDRSDLYPRETLAGTVKSVRLVDAVVMVGKPPHDQHSNPLDRRIDLDLHQREVAQAAAERGVLVLVRSRDGELHRLERCRQADRQGGLRVVPPDPEAA